VTHTCPWFFGAHGWPSSDTSVIWYIDMAGEYLCRLSLCLFWCTVWSLHVADSLFN
jgi:hypothetical protein